MRVGELTPGMVLAQAVLDVNGRLLMGDGTCLSDRFINVLKTWGIAEVTVRDEEACAVADVDEGLPEELAAQAQKIAAARFRLNDLDHPFIQEVLYLAVPRLAAHLLEEPLHASHAIPPSSERQDSPLDIEALIGSNPVLGAVPEVLVRLTQVMENPTASPAEVAGIIQNDPGLSAKLLKIVNSALYSFPQRIETISRAVTVIGVQQLSALALGVTVLGLFKDIRREFLNIQDFWRHSLACACGSRALASAMGLPNTERYFVSGLLHDVGLLLFLAQVPERAEQALAASREGFETILDAERSFLGVDHGTAGAALLGNWKLPPSLVQAAGFHHEPSGAVEVRDAAIVHAADFLASALLPGVSGHSLLLPLDPDAFRLLDVPVGVVGLVWERVEDQLYQLESIFLHHAAN